MIPITPPMFSRSEFGKTPITTLAHQNYTLRWTAQLQIYESDGLICGMKLTDLTITCEPENKGER